MSEAEAMDMEAVTPQDEYINGGDANMSDEGEGKSALQANIEKKGKNAYYFAHAHKANGPEWDGKAEPKLLGRSELPQHEKQATLSRSLSSFDPKSSITSYAFLDEERKVKLYITIPNVLEEYPNEEDIVLEYTAQSFELALYRTLPNEEEMETQERICDKRLAFSKLHGPIESVSMKKKSDKIILTFVKAEEVEWPCIGSKE